MGKVGKIANMRDLGGIPAADGRLISHGKLIRGGHLNKVRKKDIGKLSSMLGFSLVVDLRTPSELEDKPDKIPNDLEYAYLPSLTDEQNPAINRKNRTSELKRIMKHEGGAVEHLADIYRLLITQELSRTSHRNLLLKLIGNEDGAVYFHCTQGKDRTGVAAAVILMALGASREEIMKDYLNEKKSLKIKNGFITSLVGIVMLNMKAKANLSALMNAKQRCMEAALEELERVYGTMDNYICQGLGITQEQVLVLREKYLEKSNGVGY